MKLGFNTVLFGNFDIEKAFIAAHEMEYDGVELAAMGNAMSEHLDETIPVSDNAKKLKSLSKQFNLPFLSMERARHDINSWEYLSQLANEIECPIINIGPGGKMDENGVPIKEGAFDAAIESIIKHCDIGKKYGVTTCFKAHYNTCIDNTDLCIKAVKKINHEAMGLDFDPSHIYRVPEDPVKALESVVQWMKHVHFRDCISPDIQGPGTPEEQICGRGNIDLKAIINVLKKNNYNGPLVLECIGTKAKNTSFEKCTTIAAETKGWLNAVIK